MMKWKRELSQNVIKLKGNVFQMIQWLKKGPWKTMNVAT